MSNYNIFLKQGKCSYCNNNIVIQRKYSGEHLCSECFQKNIEKNIYKTISKYQFLRPKDKVIVALSGGKDSITLLYNLYKIQNQRRGSKKITALTINEGIESYRENSIKKAEDFCNKYDIEHQIISFEEKIGISLDEIINRKIKTPNYKYACNYCATIRRRLLNDSAIELGGNVLAMGHNLTDFAETYLMNILYQRLDIIGNQYFFKEESDLIKKYYVKKISPLMRIPEEEIFLYANLKKLDYYPSHCPYREKDPIIRKRVLDFIQECKKYSPEIEFNLLNGFLELSKILYYNREKKGYNSCQVCSYPCGDAKLCSYCNYLQEFNQ
ncbi:MAG: TIGR00269 family protein [Promethearchaeota archaeon]|nr:MAG: TIGR00269 family protein [Candidatus Lokiarchaeota archaeon]